MPDQIVDKKVSELNPFVGSAIDPLDLIYAVDLSGDEGDKGKKMTFAELGIAVLNVRDNYGIGTVAAASLPGYAGKSMQVHDEVGSASFHLSNSTDSAGFALNGAHMEVVASNGDLVLRADPNDAGADSKIQFAIDGSDVMRIEAGGRVFIGAVPDDGTSSLQVYGNIRMEAIGGNPNKKVLVDHEGIYMSRSSDGGYTESVLSPGGGGSMYYNARFYHYIRSNTSTKVFIGDSYAESYVRWKSHIMNMNYMNDFANGKTLMKDNGQGYVEFWSYNEPTVQSNSSTVFWIDEANDELEFKVKYGDGTAKTATLALL